MSDGTQEGRGQGGWGMLGHEGLEVNCTSSQIWGVVRVTFILILNLSAPHF